MEPGTRNREQQGRVIASQALFPVPWPLAPGVPCSRRCYHVPVITEGWADHLAGPFGIAFALSAGGISLLSPPPPPPPPAPRRCYHVPVITEGWADRLAGPFGIAFAFAAGVISFLSPCVLPLVPAYIAHLTGVASTPEATPSRRETLSHAFAFVLGFGVVFTVIGASLGPVGGLVRDELPTLEKVAGVFLIVLGLNLMGVIKVPWLYRTYQLSLGGAQPALAYAGAGSARGEGDVLSRP